MKTFRAILAQHRIVAIILLVLMSSLQLIGCDGKKDNEEKKETPSVTTEQPATPSQATVAITKIDETVLQTGQVPPVGRQVMVEGTISNPQVIVCVLVHPLTTDTWWVQNPPSPPGKIDDKTWRWRTIALCGTEELGLNEDFEIVALAESQRAFCQLGKTFKTPDFPNELPRSEIITVKRIRN